MIKRTKEVLGWIKHAGLEIVESKGSPGNLMEMQLKAKNGSTKWFKFTTIGEHPHAEQRAVERFARDNLPIQSPMSAAFARAEIAAALTINHAQQPNEPIIMAKTAPTPTLTAQAAESDHRPPAQVHTLSREKEPKADKPNKPIVKISQVQFFHLAEWCRANVRPGSDETYRMIAERAKTALGFELSPASIPTALEAVGIKLADTETRKGTITREKVRTHQRILAKRLLEVMAHCGLGSPADLLEIAAEGLKDEGGE